MMSGRAACILGVVTLVVGTGCTGDDSSAPTDPPADLVRGCDSIIATFDELPSDEVSTRFGPVVFGGIDGGRDLTIEDVTPDEQGRVTPLKLPTAIDSGGQHDVWLVVADESSTSVRLTYGVGPDISLFDQGQMVVKFEPCASSPVSQYNGGILTTALECAYLDIYVEDRQGPPSATAEIPIGAASCS